VKEAGIDVGVMQAKLLQKIEELTLYTIQQQELIEQQGKMIKEQQKTVEMLMEKIEDR
jgi:SAM-dependent MidA family methyltransferase